MTSSDLRRTLTDIANTQYEIPNGIDPANFVLSCIPFLGDTDTTFRERYAYGTLHRWVLSDAMDREGLQRIHHALLSEDALFAGIGERGTDRVFQRAFSVLMLFPILYVHRAKQPFLSADELTHTCDALVRYLTEEKDLRGYVSVEKGWAHGIAHASDAVRQIFQCPELDPAWILRLLDAAAHAITPDSSVFSHEEDARMAAAIVALLERRGVEETPFEEWLRRVVPTARFEGSLPGVHIRYVNARNFLRCLIFQSEAGGVDELYKRQIAAAHDALPGR